MLQHAEVPDSAPRRRNSDRPSWPSRRPRPSPPPRPATARRASPRVVATLTVATDQKAQILACDRAVGRRVVLRRGVTVGVASDADVFLGRPAVQRHERDLDGGPAGRAHRLTQDKVTVDVRRPRSSRRQRLSPAGGIRASVPYASLDALAHARPRAGLHHRQRQDEAYEPARPGAPPGTPVARWPRHWQRTSRTVARSSGTGGLPRPRAPTGDRSTWQRSGATPPAAPSGRGSARSWRTRPLSGSAWGSRRPRRLPTVWEGERA